MPSIVSHWLLGKRVLDKLKDNTVISDPNSFLVGCQGPDILFFHRILPWMRGENYQRYGYDMHEIAPSPIFDSLAAIVGSCPEHLRGGVLSYSLGMCCHYCYDTAAHPYVNRLTEQRELCDERGADFGYHIEIETMLDVIMLRAETGLLPCDIRLQDCLPTKPNVTEVVGYIYKRLLHDLFDLTVEDKVCAQFLPDMRRTEGMFNDKTLLKRPFMLRVEKLLGLKAGYIYSHIMPISEGDDVDYANIGREQWQNPADPAQSSDEDFMQITDRAEQRTLEMIELFISVANGGSESFAEYTQERTFSNNVPNKHE